MDNFSLLIGGKAGFGIDKAGFLLARILTRLNYRIYIYRDYPSLIRGGHTFSIIRASKEKIYTHQEKIDFLLALNQDTFDFHKDKLKENSAVIFDSDGVKIEGLSAGIKSIGLSIEKMLKEEGGLEIMRNSCIIGAFSKAAGISWETVEKTFKVDSPKLLDENLRICRRGFDQAQECLGVEPLNQEPLVFISGSQAISLGLIKAGLKTYIAYPMTPSSPILHYLAEVAKNFNLKVIHPESEISVMLMALGFAYAGEKTAVGTSGGGFCLMTEGLSLSAMAELPVTIILGQRPGPSTGLPTYSAQTELHFALSAGQGEFPRFIVAPGDAQDAYYWSAIALNLSWKYQIPSFLLCDKNLNESFFNFDINAVPEINEGQPLSWDRNTPYKRYLMTENGVSPLAFIPQEGAVIKVNSYEHDEYGITTEDINLTASMQEKRLKKEKYLSQEMESYKTVNVAGKTDAVCAVLCWGSNKGVCFEAAGKLGLKVIQPVVLSPFPVRQFQDALSGVKKLISVENNATGQLEKLIAGFGFKVDDRVLRYDGRPFALEELERELKKRAG